MASDLELLASLFPNLSMQLRLSLQNLHLAAAQLVPAAQREQDPELDARAALLDQSYYRMLRLVNELSTTAWFHPEKQPNLKNTDLVALVQGIFEKADSLARLMNRELRLICPKSQHLCAVDPAALDMLLYQLLSNALKFTPAGGRITVELQFSDAEIRLIVSDTGCGISKEQLESIFTRCLEVDDHMPIPPEGLGLGLMLCRRIAQLHKGSLTAVSEVGKGTVMTLALPNRLIDRIGLSDVPPMYDSGFNPALINLADALPVSAFLVRSE